MCPGAPDPPRHPGGVRRCHASLSTGPHLADKEGFGTDMHPSALDHTRLSGGLRCWHVSHRSPRAVGCRDKRWLSCNGIRLDSRVSKTRLHVTDAATRRVGRQRYHDLQTVRAGARTPHYSASVLITAHRCGVTVLHRAADRSRAQWVEATTRQDGTTLQTAHHVSRLTGWGMPCAARAIITLYRHLMP
jgi:hypothetical protein